jgi:putative ABC transport system permease protein
VQHIVECELVAIIGGAIGIAMSLAGIVILNNWVKTILNRPDVIQFDPQMLLLAVGLSLAAGLVAGAYPAWRVCHIAPAIHLKVQ